MENDSGKKTLIVLLGPTGVGKTHLSIRLSELFDAPIVSCDSRQFFREMKIGTAAPDSEQLKKVPHYFIGNKSIFDHYSSGQYELDVINLFENRLFEEKNTVLMVGGSMLYIDAVCNGIDDLPTVDEEVRKELLDLYDKKGIEYIRAQLKMLDPLYYSQVDLMNVKRMLHALEICMMTNRPFSSFHKKSKKERSFRILKIGLTCPRDELYAKINDRVDKMMIAGLEQEARSLFLHRALNALNTVGYKELFNYFDGTWTKDFAVSMIKQDTRRYAKKQLSWFSRDSSISWFHPSQEEPVVEYVKQKLI